MNKPSYGVIVGRFQVHQLHEGHKALFKAVNSRHGRVIVFIGISPNLFTKRNPLDFMTRKAMIQAKFPGFTVLPLLDQPTDESWSDLLDSKIREVTGYGSVTLYGGRDSFVPHYHGSYSPVELTLTGTEHIKGEDIRNQLTNTVIESPDFRAGVIFAAMNQWPKVITCVDVVMYHYAWGTPDFPSKGDFLFLLVKKPNEPGWRFCGGHAEPLDRTFEEDAKHEASEEVGQSLSKMEYIGSAFIPDWRWEAEQDKVKTLVFASETMTLEARAKDDVCEARWFSVTKINEGLINPVHHPILKLVQSRFAKEFKLYAESISKRNQTDSVSA